jgi:hypothetical protein
METMCDFETSVITRVTRHNIPEGKILHSYRREDLKSYNKIFLSPLQRFLGTVFCPKYVW